MRILMSYHYIQHINLADILAEHFAKPYPEVFLDSGAFSAFSQGTDIDIKSYCAYIHQFKHLLSVYANLDVIGNAQGTYNNQQIMEREGLQPLPVFHVGEDWRYLDEYANSYSYIALGGMVPYLKDHKYNLMPWLVKCFRIAKDRSVYHGFGCTSWKLVSSLPWHSVDSSTWSRGIRYGEISIFDRNKGKFIRMFLGKKGQGKCYQYAPVFRSLGFDPIEFADKAKNTRGRVVELAVKSFLEAETWLRKRHNTNMKLYLACNEGNLADFASIRNDSKYVHNK